MDDSTDDSMDDSSDNLMDYFVDSFMEGLANAFMGMVMDKLVTYDFNDDFIEFHRQFQLKLMLTHQASEAYRRGYRPPLKPAHVVRKNHRLAETQSKLEAEANQKENRYTISNRIYPSRNPFSHLKRTSIAKLYLEMSAVGKYIIVRVLERGYHVVGWSTVVEDDQGNVCTFCVYNYPEQELFPVGTVLILKEPYFKMACRGAQMIRCDCPTDIIVLRPSHPLFHLSQGIKWKNELCEPVDDPLYRPPVPSRAGQWKERGNALYNQKQLVLAREAYQLGLQICKQTDPTFKLLQLNLTAVNLELGYFEKVINIANEILLQFPSEKKALFRAGRAHYELRQYKEALNYFEKLKEYYPNDDEGRIELKRAKHRVEEMETGRVSIKKLQRKMAKTPMKEIDCADYIGPVKVVDVPGKGRGVVLTEDVEPETILIVSKALAASLDPNETLGMQVDPNQRLSDRNRFAIVAKLAQMMTKNPSTIGPLVYDLSTGVDTMDEIKLHCDPETKEERICDVERIKAVCKFNDFGVYSKEGGIFKELGIGLFLFPSYLNHSCVPNVKITYYNDVMIVRAAKDLKIGDELCINYVPLTLSFEKRFVWLGKRGFMCDCPRCQNCT